MKTKLTKDSLAARCAELDRENSVLTCALADVLAGSVKWFGSPRAFYLGVSRPQSACGGIAILRGTGGTVSATYFEEFAQHTLQHISLVITGENTEHNRALMQRRATIEAAQAWVKEQLRAA